MNQVTLPPSPNWYLSNIIACLDETVAWGARKSIVVAKLKENAKILDYSIIDQAHKDRITSIVFSSKVNDSYYLATSGYENVVKIWNVNDCTLYLKNSALKSDQKVIGVDWSKCKPSLVFFVSEDGVLVIWNIETDSNQTISLGKITTTCISCCPHDNNLVAVGTKSGLIYIVDIRRNGKILYKLRGHNVEVSCLSWCPAQNNVFENTSEKDYLLASGAKDRFIYIWKAGSDGRYDRVINLPSAPVDNSFHKKSVSIAAGNWTAVHWLEPKKLISNSAWGELLLWDLSENKKKYSPKLLHSKHGKGLFSITGSVNTINDLEVKRIWTVAQDRQVVCCNLNSSETLIEYNISTQGGFVYCISECPVDTAQIAFGVGDAMIRLWNLSEPHENTFDITMLWEKIKGQVRTLAWHPEKENLLAFGTNEGRVGVFDTNVSKPPILYRQHHRYTVYRVGWGVAPKIRDYALFSCGDGEVVYYDSEKPNDKPKKVTTKKGCSDFSWKPDYSILALGFDDGSITFFNNDLVESAYSIQTLSKSIQYIVWHPNSTASDLDISRMHSYLAVAVNDTVITIYNICNIERNDTLNDSATKLFKESYHKTVALLKGHSNKVVCLAWSPHISGYLVSGSYDYSAQVWKVENEELIASFNAHVGPIHCCMWSPLNPDLIITGSADFTLKIWKISDQKVNLATAKLAPPKKIRTKKNKNSGNIENSSSEAKKMVNNESTADHDKDVVNYQSSSSALTMKDSIQKGSKKKKVKKQTSFPVYAKLIRDRPAWINSLKDLLQNVTEEGCKDISNGELNGLTERKETYLLLGSKHDLTEALQHEKKLLCSQGHQNIASEIDAWCGKLKENLQQAKSEKRLTEHLVSMAPSISFKYWQEMCEAYVAQLIEEDNHQKAATYLLCLDKTLEAIDVFLNARLFKEAYVLASSKLGIDDPLVTHILTEWGSDCVKDGQFESATECYIKLKDFKKAIQCLIRRNDIESYEFAITLAEKAEDMDLSTTLADQAVTKAMMTEDIAAAKLLIENHEQIQYKKIHLEVFSLMNENFKSLTNKDICNWIKGVSNFSILEKIKQTFECCYKQYILLSQKDFAKKVENKIELQIKISYEICLAVHSESVKEKIKHFIKALEVILQFEIENINEFKNEISYTVKFFCSVSKDLIFYTDACDLDENYVYNSLGSYICIGVIQWYNSLNMCSLEETDKRECEKFILPVLEKYAKEIFNKEVIKFWTTKNEISELEKKLSTSMATLQVSEESGFDNAMDTSKIIEKLNQIRNERINFLEKRVSVPNPMYSISLVHEFIDKISDRQKQIMLKEKITNLWTTAICSEETNKIESHDMSK